MRKRVVVVLCLFASMTLFAVPGCSLGANGARSSSGSKTVSISSAWSQDALSIPWLVGQSDAVVEGTVARIGDTRMMTGPGQQPMAGRDVDIKVTRSYKGPHKANEIVVVEELGGTIGGVTYDVDSQPEFSVGEHVLVMLSSDGSVSQVTGAMHGKFTLSASGQAVRDSRIPAQYRQVPLKNITDAASSGN